MKYKFLALSLLLAGASATLNAQEAKSQYYTEKWTDNVFVGGGLGIHSNYNDGFNKVTPVINLSIGKYINPTWGVRAVVRGWEQKLETGDATMKKKYLAGNLDAMINLSTLICGVNTDRFFEVYGFVGPEISGAKRLGVKAIVDGTDVNYVTDSDESLKVRFGASAGLGMKFNINEKWAIDVEARTSVSPSIFGVLSEHHKNECKGMLTVGASYVFGGKKFARVEDRVIEKEVIKEVVREVPKEVIKEVIKEVPSAASAAVFFKIGKANISPEGKVNIKLMAKAMKANPDSKFKIAGYADKATGSASYNQKLSEKRAQAVYDALVAEGVSESQLEKVAMGGTENMFEKNYLNRVVILEVK